MCISCNNKICISCTSYNNIVCLSKSVSSLVDIWLEMFIARIVKSSWAGCM